MCQSHYLKNSGSQGLTLASTLFLVLWRTLNSDISTINSTLTTTTNTATSAYNKAFKTADDLKEYYAYLKDYRVMIGNISTGIIPGTYLGNDIIVIRIGHDVIIPPIHL